MKKIFLLLMVSAFAFASCSDEWDKHYNSNFENEEIIPMTLKEFFELGQSTALDADNPLQGDSREYMKFYSLLKESGMDKELDRDQELTIWAVKDANYFLTDEILLMGDTMLAKSHVSNLSFLKNDLKSGMKILTTSGIYLSIKKNEFDNFLANKSNILTSKRFSNGVIYELDELIGPMPNLYDYIKDLDDNYSIIRDSILFYSKKEFDRENSRPIGVDPSGNTIYDSIFVDNNPLFSRVRLNDESADFTMFLPSNRVIEDCYATMQAQYDLMGKPLLQSDSIMAMRWIKESIFIDQRVLDYENIDPLNPGAIDLRSPFNATATPRVWRTTVQQVDLSFQNIEEVSNAIIYKTTKMKIPNNVLITRIKSLVHYYEYLTAEEKERLYVGEGLQVNEVSGANGFDIFSGDATPNGAIDKEGYPVSIYWIFRAQSPLDHTGDFSVAFPPLSYDRSTGTASVMKVPPGEYNFYMGFLSKNHAFCDFYFKSGSGDFDGTEEPVAQEINLGLSSPWNYDRNTETDPNLSRWDGLGGLVGVVNVEGDGMETFRMKVKFNKFGDTNTSRRLMIYHWALKPTANNY